MSRVQKRGSLACFAYGIANQRLPDSLFHICHAGLFLRSSIEVSLKRQKFTPELVPKPAAETILLLSQVHDLDVVGCRIFNQSKQTIDRERTLLNSKRRREPREPRRNGMMCIKYNVEDDY